MKIIITLLLCLLPLKVKAYSYIVMDSDNQRVIEGKNIHQKSLIASISKIMTAMVTINNESIEKKVTVGQEVLKSFGSGIYIKPGEIITIKDLLYGLMLRSGNDAAIELAYQIGGSEESFVNLMNELALNLNMKNTTFVNPSGLEYNENANISTAYDMALLSSYAIQNETYRQIVGTKNKTLKTNMNTYSWYNKNKLLTSYQYCIGGKTGYTKRAKRTLVTNATKDNVNLTIVTIQDSDDFKHHQELYEKNFANYHNYNLIQSGEIKTKYENTYINKSFNMSLTKEERESININIGYYSQNISSVIGYVEVTLNGQVFFKEDIYQKQLDKLNNLTLIQKIKKFLGIPYNK